MRILVTALLGVFLSVFAHAAYAACGPDKLGTHRTIALDPAEHKRLIGKERKLGLRKGEVILTFDDGPIAGKTARILKALRRECVKATFFAVAKMAKYQPKLLKRIVRDGHTLGHHTYNHNKLTRYSVKKAGYLVDRGIKIVEKIAYGKATKKPRVPFFRYPYLSRTNKTNRMMARKGLIIFDANIDANDWKKVSANTVHNRIMRRLKAEKKGIILMHDIQHRTAKMLPRLLRSLKAGGYKVVHVVPRSGPVKPLPGIDTPLVMAGLKEAVEQVPTPRFKPVEKSKAQLAVKAKAKPVEEPAAKTTAPPVAKLGMTQVRARKTKLETITVLSGVSPQVTGVTKLAAKAVEQLPVDPIYTDSIQSVVIPEPPIAVKVTADAKSDAASIAKLGWKLRLSN